MVEEGGRKLREAANTFVYFLVWQGNKSCNISKRVEKGSRTLH